MPPQTNIQNVPLPIVAAIANDDHISQGSDIGAATVAAPVRQVALLKKHRATLTTDVSDRIWSLLGQAVHVVLERAGKDQGAERRKLDDAIALVESLLSEPYDPDLHREGDALERAVDPVGAVLTSLYGLRERYDPNPQPFRTFVEERWEIPILGWRVAARCDHLTLDDDGTLTDYKVSSVWSVKEGAKPEWVAQLNVTRYCGTVDKGLRPKNLQATVIARDWRKNERLRYGDDYPPYQIATVPVPYWSDDECLAYLEDRVAAHQNAQLALAAAAPLPECSAEERWEKPTIYAVMKTGRKTAVRLYQDRTLAEKHAETDRALSVTVRPGESTRCAQYCDALAVCEQGQRILKDLAAKAATEAAS